jgi:hypothetical protein
MDPKVFQERFKQQSELAAPLLLAGRLLGLIDCEDDESMLFRNNPSQPT